MTEKIYTLQMCTVHIVTKALSLQTTTESVMACFITATHC